MSELRRFEKWFERPNEHYDPVDGDFVGSMYDIAKVAWMAKADDVDKRIEQLKQRNKEFFIAGFEAGKLNEKKANHKMPGTIMHADSAYEAYLGYRDIQNES